MRAPLVQFIVQTQTDQQLLGRIVTHLFLAVVDGRGFQHHSKVASGRDRNAGAGNADAQNVVIFVFQTRTLVILGGVPGFLYHPVS